MLKSSTVPNHWLLRIVDRVADVCGHIGVLMIIFITAALTYETIARYFFHAPTQWTQDISVTMQVWFTYLGMALVLKEGKMIRITAMLGIAPAWVRYACEALGLIIILLFSIMATVKGFDVVTDSIALGRRQPTMLALPNWIAELPVVLGFALLSLQSLAELIRLPFRGPPSFDPESELELDDEPSHNTAGKEANA
ncbi:TRAP transporter small permease [Pusillimonas sp. ANT_WB101]|uniref:TRAP transporter small permease n=1 Tax=Pusillimonas sp. ANT_WB101 TaxID=2597356 RepID=UPI0011ED6905|nr:TRAP transporter small permease [Pusillimonas sp. ANT_WB101]KAA0911259.1 TRAP transporter small permease [Pusillimonas sp. ANT_WB101]